MTTEDAVFFPKPTHLVPGCIVKPSGTVTAVPLVRHHTTSLGVQTSAALASRAFLSQTGAMQAFPHPLARLNAVKDTRAAGYRNLLSYMAVDEFTYTGQPSQLLPFSTA